jgi:hypothetical protein
MEKALFGPILIVLITMCVYYTFISLLIIFNKAVIGLCQYLKFGSSYLLDMMQGKQIWYRVVC